MHKLHLPLGYAGSYNLGGRWILRCTGLDSEPDVSCSHSSDHFWSPPYQGWDQAQGAEMGALRVRSKLFLFPLSVISSSINGISSLVNSSTRAWGARASTWFMWGARPQSPSKPLKAPSSFYPAASMHSPTKARGNEVQASSSHSLSSVHTLWQ